jgi:predicted nicotinamide N-methyase
VTESLVKTLENRFRTSIDEVTVGKQTFNILRPANSDDLIREEDFVKDERLPYWADIWPSSVILAERLMELKGDGKTALELGCGVGLSTLAATKAGFDVLSTDYYEDALDVTRANVFRILGKSAKTRLVDWRHFPDDLGTFDLVFASDVLYEKEYAALLPGLFVRSLAAGGVALVADPGRIAVPVFLEACEAARLKIRKKQTRPFAAGPIRQSIDIFEIVQATAK